MVQRALLIVLSLVICGFVDAKLPEIKPTTVLTKMKEIMQMHASQRELNPQIMKRTLQNYIEGMDPNKTYFIQSDIDHWIEPSDSYLDKMLNDYENTDYAVFDQIHETMIKAITRRYGLEKQIDLTALPEKVNPKDLKDIDWVSDEQELLDRIAMFKSLEVDTYSKLDDELKDTTLQRIAKYRTSYEEKYLQVDPTQRQQMILSNVLKASASALDSQTSYFTPDEATQFLINVQQRLFGIGAQLRDDINGFTVVKIVEGSPAESGGDLKVKDRIIAVDGEPVVGKDILEVVEHIRGEENSPVVLTVIREEGEEGKKEETRVDVTIMRGEVVLKESRFETSFQPFGDGVIAYVRLFTFYEDPESASSKDIAKAIEELKEEHNVKGIILDLRSNTGGLLTQAVGVTGLFISKGIVVGIKDNTDAIQYLRDTDGKAVWDGALVVMVNRASASASEIVAQTLQDYGRAIIVGDEFTYGKGSFQTFTLNGRMNEQVNPEGEYKVTRGRYYTVSGKSPQLVGVKADLTVPGVLSEMDIGEEHSKFPLENDSIKPNFEDDLSDVPYSQREKIRMLYKFDLQPIMTEYTDHLDQLRKNSNYRIEKDTNYQNFLKELKKTDYFEEDEQEEFGKNDLQLMEGYNIMKDLILLQN